MYTLEQMIVLVADYRHRRDMRGQWTNNLVIIVSRRNWQALLEECSRMSLSAFMAYAFDHDAQEFKLADVRISWSPMVRDGNFIKGVYNGD